MTMTGRKDKPTLTPRRDSELKVRTDGLPSCKFSPIMLHSANPTDYNPYTESFLNLLVRDKNGYEDNQWIKTYRRGILQKEKTLQLLSRVGFAGSNVHL